MFSSLVGAIALMGVMAGTPAMGQSAERRSDVRVRLKLKDADMIAATRSLSEQTGLQFVVRPSDRPYDRITLTLVDQTPEDAIAYICQAAGAYFRRDESGVFIISHERPAPEAVAPVTESARPARLLRKIRLVHGDPEAIYKQIAYAQVTDPQSAYTQLKRFRSLAQLEQNTNGMSPEMVAGQRAYSGGGFANQASYPTVSTAPTTPTIVTPNDIPSLGGESGSDVRLPGESGNQRVGGAGQGIGGGGGGQGGIGGAGGQGGIGGGQGGQVSLRGGTGLIPDTIDYISYDPTDNSLIVRGSSEDDINELQNTIATFDIAPQQVIIKVEFITTTQTLAKSLGYSVQYSRGTLVTGTDPGTFLQLSDPVFLTYATGNAVLRLRTQLSESQGKLVTAPIIRTLNNQPATVFAYTNSYIFATNQIVTNGIISNTVNPITITSGTSLTVAPRINADGFITLALNPQVGGISNIQLGPNGVQYPNVSQQGVYCVARVRNRETIVLGGLNIENILYSENRVPVLGDLPIIGQFFRRRITNKNNSELLIFVTPEVVQDDSGDNINP